MCIILRIAVAPKDYRYGFPDHIQKVSFLRVSLGVSHLTQMFNLKRGGHMYPEDCIDAAIDAIDHPNFEINKIVCGLILLYHIFLRVSLIHCFQLSLSGDTGVCSIG